MRKISPARLVYSDLLVQEENALLSLVVRDSIAKQIAVDVIFTMASFGFTIFGSGTVSTRTSSFRTNKALSYGLVRWLSSLWVLRDHSSTLKVG